jgi:hypothetical protein
MSTLTKTALTTTTANATYLVVKDPGGPENIIIGAPTLGASYSLTLPNTDGTNGYVLTTDGSGILSWEAPGTGNINWWTQQGSKIVGTGGSGTQRQGGSLSLSSDGNTLAVGGYSNSSNTGATWIFTRSAGLWTQQDKLVGTTSATGQLQGYSVSLSSDGNTLAVGGIGDSSFTGATWIFTRSAGVWTQQDKLVGATSVTGQRQGTSVSLSSDGNTLAVGGPNDSTVTGATWIFTRSAGVWTQQGSKLVGATSATFQYQGSSVSLSSDGNTLAVGGMGDSSNTGATWIFTRSAGVWTQQGSKLVGATSATDQYQGSSVSLSSDGNTLAVGGPGITSSTSATWIFTRSDGVWTQQGSKLVGATSATGQYQGYSVSLSSDGNTLAVGGYGDSGNIGATWIFMRSAGSWTQQGSKIIGTTSAANQYQGYSVSLRGNTLAVGGEGDSSNTGATWVFTTFNSVLNVYGTADRITSSGGQNPVIDIASTYAGQTSITTLGTITTGAWGSIINTPSTILSTNTTASTSTTTGSLINSGGFGNAGRIWTTDISVVNRNYCSIYTSSNISIPDNTPTNPFSISSGTVSQSGSVSGTSGGIITINENGMYIISTNTTWSNPSSLTGWRSLSFVLSSSVYGNTIYPAQSYDSIATTNGQDQSGCIVLPLTAGITLNLRVFQTSGSSVDLRYMTLLTVSRIIS